MAIIVKKFPKREVAENIPFPAESSNKYTRGKLVIVGGCSAYPGSVCLAADAALRMGSGYVETVCSAEATSAMHTLDPDVVATDYSDWSPSDSGLDVVKESDPKACLVGSGFDAKDELQVSLVLKCLKQVQSPLIIDGGAMTVLATEVGREAALSRFESGLVTVLTPHFGEAERLAKPLQIDMSVVSHEHRMRDATLAQRLAFAYGSTVLLKGPDSYIANPQRSATGDEDLVDVMTRGTAALAKAGTGDVLAGMVGALCSQALDARITANVAAALHAQAGREASSVSTDICVRAKDLPDHIPAAIKYYMRFCE